ncbi:MAG: gliding motility-associated C-terminal domain-containing protein [Paludibacteraceae bacterium]|nr:gliding motility-associated C-terminal domain-containing protein [Paludibacteraceae bacterium]
MKTKTILQSFGKVGCALALSLLSFTNAGAEIVVTTSDATTGACVGSVVQVNAAGTNDDLLQYQYREDGGDWKNLGSPTRSTVNILEKMPNSMVYFRVLDLENSANSSNPDGQSVAVRTEGCPEECVTSSSGDYIHGTDFNLKNGSGTQKPEIPGGIVHAFDKGESRLTFTKKDVNSYHVSNDMTQVFPDGEKPKNYTSDNYYYMYDPYTEKGKPFQYTFPYKLWHDKPYTFRMEFYLLFDGCGIDPSAAVKLETGQGNFGYQQADVKVFIDENDEIVSNTTTDGESFGHAKLFSDASLVGNAKNNRDYLKNKLLRVEATFYGVFPHTGNSKLGTWNGDADFGMYPLFEQFGSCVKMAIDFISAELPSVCIANNSKCKGESIVVNAAGFPEDVVSGNKYEWYEKVNGSWVKMEEPRIKPLNGLQSISVPIDYFGKREYKLSATTTNPFIDNKTIEVFFELGGKDCDPTKPDGIDGDNQICYDKKASPAVKTKYDVHSQDTDDNVNYRWTLTNNDTNEEYQIGNGVSSDLKGDVLSNASTNLRMPSIYVAYPKAGHYTLKLEVYKSTGVGGQFDKVTNADYTKTLNITVYDKPTGDFHIVDDSNNPITELCPFSSNKLLVSDVDNPSLYDYVWTGATETVPGIANVDFSGNPCDMKGKTYSVTLSVQLKAMPTCAAVVTKPLATNFARPAIDCESLRGKYDINSKDYVEYIVESAHNFEARVPLRKPALVGNSCNNNPKVTITITGKDVEGNTVNKTIEKQYADMTDLNTYIDLPPSAGKTGDNAYTVTYTVSNGCGGTNDVSEPCSFNVVIRYNYNPNVNCNSLTPKILTGYLSAYGSACLATPGSGSAVIPGHNPLPLISTQVIKLTDTNLGDVLQGVVVSVNADEARPVGNYTVVWRFTNRAGNYADCEQTIQVIDDTKPIADCHTTDDVIEISTDAAACTTSAASLYAQLKESLGGVEPTAVPACNTSSVELISSKYYQLEGTDKWNKWSDDAVFEKGKSYTILWTFKKKIITNVSDDSVVCRQNVKIVDNEKPNISCQGAGTYVVTVNYWKMGTDMSNNEPDIYASATGNSVPKKEYTLKDIFYIPTATDNCDGTLYPSIRIDTLNSAGETISKVITSSDETPVEQLDKINRHRFYKDNVYTVVYLFVDAAGNRDSCVTQISVVDRDKPDVTCWDPDIIPAQADADCKAVVDNFSFDNLVGSLDREFTDGHLAHINIKSTTTNHGVTTTSTKILKNIMPSRITRVRYELIGKDQYSTTPIVECDKNVSKDKLSDGTYIEKYSKCILEKGAGNCTEYVYLSCISDASSTSSSKRKKVHYKELYEGCLSTTFNLGKTIITFAYDNGKGDTARCFGTVLVEDKTKPTIDCGTDYAITKTYQLPDADNCVLPKGLTEIKVPTLDDLSAEDNCTPKENLKLSIEVHGVKVPDVPATFPIGTTVLNFVVTDIAGNSSYCTNTITVEDKTAPDCDYLGLQNIDVPADENCEASPASVFPGGFNPPAVNNDLCSPVTDQVLLTADGKIKGVGTRDDGKEIFEDYYQKSTVITWQFTDAAGNSSFCSQTVTVNDETEPNLVCEPRDIKYTLKATECLAPYASVQLKQPKITDNCSNKFDVSFTRQYVYADGSMGAVVSDNAHLEDPFRPGTTIIVWTVKDEAGNPATCSQNIIVTDENPLNFDCPDDIDDNAPEGSCEKSLTIDPSTPDYVRKHKCYNYDIVPTLTKRTFNGEVVTANLNPVYGVGVTELYWMYRDSSGNEQECVQTITIHDKTKPEVKCKPAQLYTDSTGKGSCVLATGTLIDHLVKKNLIPSATDACQTETPEMTGERYYLGLDAKGTPVLQRDADGKVIPWNESTVPYKPGYYIIRFIFTDKEGNSDYCEQEIFIKDSNEPNIDCDAFAPSKPVNPAKDKCEFEIKLSTLGATGNATESCDDTKPITGVPYIFEGDILSGSIDDLKPFETTTLSSGEKLIVVWKFTSHHQVDKYCTQIISVEDKQAPTCNPDPIVALTADDATDCTAEVLVDLEKLNAKDNCGNDGIKYEYSFNGGDYQLATGSFKIQDVEVGTYTIDWRLTDKFGVSVGEDAVSCTSSVTVKDNTMASCDDYTMPDVPTLDDATDCKASFTLALPTGVTDNCAKPEDVTYAYKFDDEEFVPISKPKVLNNVSVGTHVITWRLFDGTVYNENGCKTTVTVVDKTAPTCTDKDMGEIKSDLTACSTDVEIKLTDIAATDNCGKPIKYKYKFDDDATYTAIAEDESFNFEVGPHTIYWQISDGTNESDEAACKTTFTILGNVPLKITCEDDAPEKTFKTDDCGPVDISAIDVPQATDPCFGKVDGTPNIDLSKPLTLGDHSIVWTFVNHDKTQTTTCTQTIHVVTTQKLIMDCESPAAPFKLTDGNCMINVPLTQRLAENPCNDKEIIKGEAYVFGEKVLPADYKTQMFPAGSWDVIWKFKSVTNTLETFEDQCKETIIVDDENGATLPCKDGEKVEKTIDGCEVDAAELDFKNTSVIADEICWDGHTVTPDIWLTPKEGDDPVKVNDPKDLGTFRPGKYEVTWEYIFHPSGKGELKAYCHQPIEIMTTKEIVIDCDDPEFAAIPKDANDKCEVPADEVTFNAPNATNPCDATVSIAPQAYIGDKKISGNTFTEAFPLGTTTITWKYVDETGTLTNSVATCTQDVVVTDNTNPTVTCQDDITYYLGRDVDGVQSECNATPVAIDLKRPTVEDNCTSSAEDFRFWLKRELNGVEVDSLAPYEPGTTVVTWTVKDKAGNASTCSMNVIVLDTVSPKPVCPADMPNIEAPEGKCEAEIPAISPEAYKFKDKCDTEEIIPVGTRSDDKAISDPYPVGTTTITWVYTDSVNSLLPVGDPNRYEFVCRQVISVADITKPLVDCSNTSTPINEETVVGECEVPADKIIDKITLPTATDACQTEAPVMTSNRWYLGREGDSIPTRKLNDADEDIKWNDDVPFKAGYYEIHFIFTDNYGNADSCSQKVFVKDMNPPYLNDCKEITDKVLNPENGECDAAIVPVELNAYKGKEVCTGEDIEGVPSLLVKVDDEFVVSTDPIPATVTSGDSIYIRWTYTSQMGISAYCDQMIKVVDNQKPVIKCDILTPPITLTADPEECFISAANANIQAPTVEDNCGTITGRPVRIDTLTNLPNGLTMEDPYPTGKSVIRWYFVDTNPENADSCDQTVFVKGSVKPEIDCDTITGVVLRDTIETCDIAEQTLKVNIPVAIDKCAPTEDMKSVNGVGVRSDGKEINDLYPLGITTITWSFTDFTGNAVATCTQDVNIVTKQRLITDCADTTAVYDLEKDECLKDVTLDQRTAKHPCPEAVAEADRQFNGVPYLNGATEPLTSLNIKLPQGKHYVTWVFTDNTHTLAAPIDSCIDSIKVGNDNVPPVPCVNDRIDTTLQDLCELPAAKVDLKNTGVDAPQLCGDDGEMVTPEIWTAKFPTHVNDPADLPPFHTGVDTVFWKYDFNPGHQGIFTVWCKQVVDVKTDKGIDLACPDSADNVITVIAPEHACEVPADTITLNPVVGKNPCIDTVFITGVPDRDTTLAWPIGLTTITYTYTDTTKTLINNIATCKQYVDVKDTANPDIDCEALYTGINQILANCKISADELGLQGIDVTQCGFVMTPVPTRFSGKAFTDDYVAGNDTVYWTYTYQHNGLTTVCPQPVILRDTTPVFDCKDLNTITLTAPEEKCVIEKSLAEVLDALEPYPTAIDPCDAANPIPGVYKVAGVDTLPTQLTAGDTIHVIWSFADADRFADTAFCDQYVIIKGNVTPEIDCEVAAPAIKDTIDDCGPDHELKLPIVKAYDPCFSDSIPGSFVRDDNEEELNAPFQLGHTNVTWTFWNVDSTKSKICEQDVHVYTRREIEKPCDTASMPVVEVPAPEDACTVPADDVKLTPAFAISPCTRDTIWGVPTRFDGEEMNAPYKIGKTIIIWTFNDVTDNLVIQSDTCHQIVRVGSVEVEPVKCDSFPAIEKVLAEGNCTIDAAELGIKAPTIIDRCPNGAADAEPEFVKPIITRFSKPGWTSSEETEIAEFGVGYDTLWWSYPRFSTVCAQPIHIMDSMAPKFNCDDLKPLLVETEKGKCDVNMADIITEPYPFATEYCIDSVIVGVPTLLNGDPLPTSLKAGDSIVVKWTFSAPDYSVVDKTCEQPVRVIGTAAPQFDCNSLTMLEFTTDSCSLELGEQNIPVPVATDSCTGKDVPGVGSREDGGDVFGKYPLGQTLITWTFTSPDSKITKTCEQLVEVKTKREVDAKCGEENYPSLSFDVKNGKCVIPADTLNLTAHEAYNPCNTDIKIEGVPTRSDDKEMDAPYELGVTTITWTFTDTTNTLVNPVSTCTQTVTVTNANTPDVECPTSFPAVRVSLDTDDCNLDFSKIPVYLNPIPTNPCSDEIALIDTTRKSGKGVKEPYEVGVDTIVWKLWFASNELPVFCEQRVEVVDTIAPAFDCSVLADTIVVEIKTAGNTVTFEEVKDKGFYIPEVTDKCSEVFTEVTRGDDKELEEDYKLGNTLITFRFSDVYGNDTVCSQIIKVVDMIPPKVICPPLEMNIACYADTTPAYGSFDEFVAAGGKVDPVEKANLFTFRHEDKFEGDSCKAVITRNYYLTSINEVDVHCESAQHFYVKDSIAPYYVGIPANGSSKVTTCDKLDIEPPVVTAEDNCDPEPSLKMFTRSTQGDDPSKCDYYTYDVTYTWVAADRCGNVADSVRYIVHVKDTVSPDVNLPEDWDAPEHPIYLKKCRFGVPDLTALIDTNWISQNCGSNEYLTFTQSPAAGTEITQTTVVKLYVTDVCGNSTELQKVVEVQPREEIVKITPSIDPIVCGGDGTLDTLREAVNCLADTRIRKASGFTWNQDWDGTWVKAKTVILWDYYRSVLDEDHLVYSNNPQTYGDRFESTNTYYGQSAEDKAKADAAFARYLMLLRQHQSDTYFFVAQDTVSGCTDTASVNIHVHEAPRLQLESGDWTLCEGDSLALRGSFGSNFPVCVNDMGGAILEEGWMINDAIYYPHDSVNYDGGIKHTAIYYATNHCGTTTTFTSLFTTCSGDLLTREDSLAAAGSDANFKLMQQDKLITRDSVAIDVYTHYDPAQVLLTTYPQVKPRVWTGEDADLILTLPYKPSYLSWRRVEGDFDARSGAEFDNLGAIIYGGSGENDDIDLYQEYWNKRDTTIADSIHSEKSGLKTFRYTIAPTDTSYYYAVVSNGVCPAVASNMVNVDVLKDIPTAITPYTKDGRNDNFRPGHHVVIFNRYGQMIYESNDGWDGTYRGLLADPGVYFYSLELKNGTVYKGSIEVVKIE